jgi:rhomboid protease GluP
MTQGRSPHDNETREFLERLEREFQRREQDGARAGEPYESPRSPYEPATPPVIVEPYTPPPQPVRLTLPLSRPRLVFALLAANVIMFVLTQLMAARIAVPYVDATHGSVIVNPFTAALYVLGAKENNAINGGEWWRLLSPMVLHGSLMHLLFNSWALYILGTEAERVYGTARFATVYLLAGLAGSIASYVFNPGSLAVGASGAIFGLLGALAAFSFASRALIGREATKMQIGQMATLAAINLFLGFAVPNIDNSAHIGGLIAGGIAGLALAPRYAVVRQAYAPSIERRDPPALGWAVAGALLIALIVWFVLVSPY